MYRPLVPCPGCARHVLATERACPFCASPLPDGLAARPDVKPRMSRSAMAALGAALTLSACSSTVVGGDGSVPSADAPAADAPADAPRADVPVADARTDVPAEDNGAILPAYGTPPPTDAGPDDDGGSMAEYGSPPPMDGGGNVNLYGAPPPPPDASVDGADGSSGGGGGGGIMPLYGAPPDDV